MNLKMPDSQENEGMRRTYTAHQVAQILGVSIRKVYKLCDTGGFQVVRLGKRCLRIHKESFDRWFSRM